MTVACLRRFFPIDHPEYRYPGSTNPYWSRLKTLQGLVYSDNDTENHRGQWRSLFSEVPTNLNQELHVEIGCNAGHVVTEWAHSHPQKTYIGIDSKQKAIFRAAEKAQKKHLKNILLLRAHAERLPFIFGAGEIDYLYLFFPDPWPKKGHWKNRLMTPERLKEFSGLMKPGGIFTLKTDHPGYFEWILEAVNSSLEHWEVLEVNKDLYKDHPNPEALAIPEVTLFEKLFIRQKLPIQLIKLRAKPLTLTSNLFSRSPSNSA